MNARSSTAVRHTRPRPSPKTEGLNNLDRVRAGSLADEGGVAAATVEVEDAARETREKSPRARSAGLRQPATLLEGASMLFELSILPLGGDAHLSDELAQVLKVVEVSGLPYRLGPGSTYIEGSWDQVMPVIRACHACARGASKHVVTMVRIEDDEGQPGKIHRNVESVEAKAGHKLERDVG